MNLKPIAAALALLGVGFGAGAWWMQARLAPEIAALEHAAGESLIADLAKFSVAVPGPVLPDVSATTAPPPVSPRGATTPRDVAAAIANPERGLPFPGGLDPTTMSNGDYKKAVEAKFANEAPDLEWKREMEGKLTDHFYRGNPLGEGSTLDSVECKATLCKVVAHSPDRDQEHVVGPRSYRWNDMMAFWIQTQIPPGEGPTEVMLYLAPQPAAPPP